MDQESQSRHTYSMSGPVKGVGQFSPVLGKIGSMTLTMALVYTTTRIVSDASNNINFDNGCKE